MTDRELMQQALYALQESKPIDINDPTAFYRSAHAIEALRARLAQPEPEPVVWKFAGALFHDRDEVFSWYKRGDVSNIPPLPLYTAPPQREWQGLTDEEIDQAAWPHFIGNILPSVKLIVRQLEAKLKEKNHD